VSLHVHHFGDSGTRCTFERGALNVVLGRNGAGKTALCRLVAGLDAPGEARVELDGADLTVVPARRREVALVFGEFVNYPSLTVFENIAAPLRAAGRPRREITDAVRAIAQTVGLEAFLDRLPEALSGGQQQRVALARALVRDARVLLLDEPLANLDYKLRETLQAELVALLAGRDTHVIYTTSDPREALALGDRVLLLDRGVPLQAGPPLEVLRAPSSPAAADLMSDPGINLVRARVSGADRGTLELGERGAALLCPAALRGRRGVFLLGVRPDHLQLAEGGAPQRDALRLEGRVALAETNGSETFVHVEAAGVEWVAHLDGLQALAVDSPVALAAHGADLLAFEADAGGAP